MTEYIEQAKKHTNKESYVAKVTISPQIAAEWLTLNKYNRPLSNVHVKRLENEIINGRWQEDSSDCISFDVDGFLINGQHRLTAILNCGVTVNAYVIFNAAKDARVIFVPEKQRTIRDNIFLSNSQGITDWKYVNSLITVSRIALTLIITKGSVANFNRIQGNISNHDIREYIDRNYNDIITAIEYTKVSRGRNVLFPISHIFAAYILLKNGVSKEEIDSFWTKISEKIGITPKSGAQVLVRKMELMQANHASSVFLRNEFILFVLKAFYLEQKGTRVLSLSLTDNDRSSLGLLYQKL